MPDRPTEPPFDPRDRRNYPSRDPRYDPRQDPRYDPRDDPRFGAGEAGGLDPRRDPRYDPTDPRYDLRGDTRYDPRADPRGDPSYDPRAAPQYDPRTDPRTDPRYDPRSDPRYDPYADQRYDPQATRDPRLGGPVPPPPPVASPPASTGRPPSRGRLLAILAGLLALLLIGFFAYRLTRAGPAEDRLNEEAAASDNAAVTEGPAERCGTQRTYDLVKQQLFRRAAQVRGTDQAAFDRLAAYAVVRVDSPVLKRQDEELGTQVCSGNVSIDLPPGVAVVGGRRTLTAEMDYALQPTADGSGDVVTLSGADAIVVPLATLARTGTQPGLPQAVPPGQPLPQAAPPGSSQQSAPVPVPAPPVAPRAPAPAPRADPAPAAPRASAARPSFNCGNARTRGEIAVCNDPELASLDRLMAAQFVSATRRADPEQRALLQRTRGDFLRHRDQCPSDACVAQTYRGRMREITDIMSGRWQPPR